VPAAGSGCRWPRAAAARERAFGIGGRKPVASCFQVAGMGPRARNPTGHCSARSERVAWVFDQQHKALTLLSPHF